MKNALLTGLLMILFCGGSIAASKDVSKIISVEIKETKSQYFIVEIKGSDRDKYLVEVPLKNQMPVLNSNINASNVYVNSNGVNYKQHILKEKSIFSFLRLILTVMMVLLLYLGCRYVFLK